LCLCKLPSDSTLSGIHGVPRVHYKGKQGEYYIMVMKHAVFPLHFHIRLSVYTIWTACILTRFTFSALMT
jgi:hypothetical protein